MYRNSDLQTMFLGKALHRSAFSSVSKSPAGRSTDAEEKAIQFFTTCPEAWGGSEELWSGVARRLSSQSYRVTANLSFLAPTHPQIIKLIEAGVRVERYRGVPFFWRYHGFGGRWEPALTVARLRAAKPELAVISQGENMDGHRQIVYCRTASIPYVIICQKAMEDHCPMDDQREELRKSFRQAERIFFVSQHNREVTEERLGQKLGNAEVVWNPFNVNYEPDLEWPGMENGQFRLACVARLWMRDKGQDILLKVLSQEKWKKRGLEVDFYGHGLNADALTEMAAMLGIKKVRFCGFSPDVTEIWRRHHALILPSRHEGLPLALVEAMLCGRPAIVTRAGGNAEVLDDEESGFLAPAVSPEGLDEAMERAWNRRSEWQKIGLNAARSIRKKVPQDPCAIFAEKLEAIYRDVVKAK
jgi:glycosyltransferase involved in cell wall biosynthesis